MNTDPVFLERVVFEDHVPRITIEFGPPKSWVMGIRYLYSGRQSEFWANRKFVGVKSCRCQKFVGVMSHVCACACVCVRVRALACACVCVRARLPACKRARLPACPPARLPACPPVPARARLPAPASACQRLPAPASACQRARHCPEDGPRDGGTPTFDS